MALGILFDEIGQILGNHDVFEAGSIIERTDFRNFGDFFRQEISMLKAARTRFAFHQSSYAQKPSTTTANTAAAAHAISGTEVTR